MKRFTFLTLFLAAMAAAIAAPGSNSKDRSATDSVAVVKSEKGDADGAAEAAGAGNTASHGTAAWYQQSAIELLQYAYRLQGLQDDSDAKRAATAATKILTRALQADGAASASERGQTYVLIGHIYQELLRDSKQARQAYNAALKEDSDNIVAKHMLDRYAAEDANAARFNNPGK